MIADTWNQHVCIQYGHNPRGVQFIEKSEREGGIKGVVLYMKTTCECCILEM